ncbi:unnamed protein product [Coffea canephora]|uniref:DH200=94 genomic scaffold, scaffold_1719 n=1 Tax=Coffea canephora TaxID=49390 RepID=A0A068VJ95_COFCA|nr:unnamed protein product [Coffea canephora]
MGLNETKGSWCLLTTRLEPVANAVPRHLQMNDGPYFLGKLSDDACCKFKKKCDGLPLAAKLIGGLLLNSGLEKWQSIVKESLLNEYQSQINQVLKVSFDHLSPPSVKKCFACCSIFPQDTELGEDELIQHWIAEGFVLKNNRVMEETGGEYLRIFLQNSLLEKVQGSWRTYYKMHDLVHDFAKSILNPESSNQDRYLALNSSEGLAENTTRTIPASIRTLFLHVKGGISVDMLLRFKYLHVLRLYGNDVKFLPSSIGKLPSLRLLDISSSGIRSLPESLCKLYNLQTLTMRDDVLEGGFPKRMSDLISLGHLNYNDDDAEFKMPMQMGRLTRLQTLKFFNVSQEKGCGIEELGSLTYLKRSLSVRNLGLVKGKEAAKQAKLVEKPDLSELEFEWEKEEGRSRASGSSTRRRKFFPALESLWVIGCLQLTTLPCSCKSLDVQRCHNLTSIKMGYGTASVEELSIRFCDNLRELPDLDLFGPSLQRLTISFCPRLISLGSCRSLRSLSVKRLSQIDPS